MPRRPILRWAARFAAGALALVAAAACAVYGLSERRIRAHFAVPDHVLTVSSDSATIARGQHLATIRGCVDCHGAALGGDTLVDEPVLGLLAGANLTNGGRGAALTDRDWERAVRHGVRRDGTPLLFMPANEFTTISDEDLGAIVAYARSLPSSANAPPISRAGPMLRALQTAGMLTVLPAEEIEHAKPHLARIDPAPTATYGAYLAAGCTGCHGPGFSGGKIPGAPPDWKPAANITPSGIGHYTQTDFIRALRTGVRPSGAPIDTLMPWRLTKQMTDVELEALYAYLRTVPAKEYGMR